MERRPYLKLFSLSIPLVRPDSSANPSRLPGLNPIIFQRLLADIAEPVDMPLFAIYKMTSRFESWQHSGTTLIGGGRYGLNADRLTGDFL
jgi:hypothetical protein